jgi:hypothetical protein
MILKAVRRTFILSSCKVSLGLPGTHGGRPRSHVEIYAAGRRNGFGMVDAARAGRLRFGEEFKE